MEQLKNEKLQAVFTWKLKEPSFMTGNVKNIVVNGKCTDYTTYKDS